MRIVVVPFNKIDDESIDELVFTVQNIDSSWEVKKGFEIKRNDIVLIEIVGIYLAVKTGEVILKKIIEAGIDWGTKRLKEKKENPMPVVISIFGPNGIPLVAKRINEDGTVEDTTRYEHRMPLPIELL